MSQIIPIYIPTYISDAAYKPSRVLPRLFFYNGMIECEPWYLESGSAAIGGVTYQQFAFPYFDNYSVVTGSFPTEGSLSLLFNNEAASYGAIPSGSLYTNYWETYISLLYNPKTRLLTCKAIIPLADYVKMELNDIVNFRGNYYHLRAINNYSLKTGDCELQLLGPIIADTFSNLQPTPPEPPTSSFADVSWSFSETNASGELRIYDNGSNIATLATNGSGNAKITASHFVNAEMNPIGWVSGVSMSLDWNGGTTIALDATTDTTLTSSVSVAAGTTYYITGSVFSSASCCQPTITTASVSGGDISIFFTTGSGCAACSYTTLQTSADGVTWGGNNTSGCTSPRVVTAPTSSLYYRIQIGCVSTTSSYSDSYYYVSSSAPSVYEFNGCGRGSSVAVACSDAANNRTFYSDCDSGTFGVGCYVYVDTFPNALTGYNNVFMNGASWDISSVTGIVTAYSSEQC